MRRLNRHCRGAVRDVRTVKGRRKGAMSRRRDKDSVYSFPDDLHTQTPKEQLSALAQEYLEAIRPYLNQMREITDLYEQRPEDSVRIEAGHHRLDELCRTDERERTHDAIDDALGLVVPKNDCDFLVYELLRQSANSYEECWVLTDWEDNITPPLPVAVRHLIGQAVARSPEIQDVADRAHWLDHETESAPR
jgi:hypothetical protein